MRCICSDLRKLYLYRTHTVFVQDAIDISTSVWYNTITIQGGEISMNENNGERILDRIRSESVACASSWTDDGGSYHDGGWNDSWPDGWSDSHR